MANARKQGQQEELQEVVACEIRSKVAMREWCEKNPADGKWTGQRTHDFTQHLRIQGTCNKHGDVDQDCMANDRSRVSPLGHGHGAADQHRGHQLVEGAARILQEGLQGQRSSWGSGSSASLI